MHVAIRWGELLPHEVIVLDSVKSVKVDTAASNGVGHDGRVERYSPIRNVRLLRMWVILRVLLLLMSMSTFMIMLRVKNYYYGVMNLYSRPSLEVASKDIEVTNVVHVDKVGVGLVIVVIV